MSGPATNASAARALVDSNTREANDLVSQLTMLLDRVDSEPQNVLEARMVTRQLSDRLAQAGTLGRLASGAGWRPDAWSPVELIEELEHEAVSLAGSRIDVRVVAPDLIPQFWFFDRELVATALSGALHAAIFHAIRKVDLEFGMRDGYLGLGIGDDAGAFPVDLLDGASGHFERGECNGNALGVHFARMVADLHVNKARRGRVELRNRPNGSGTEFTLWLP